MTRLALISCVFLTALAATAVDAVAATAPSATTGKSSGATATTVNLAGTINPHGHPTSYYFAFGTSKSYGSRSATGNAGAGTATVNVSASLTGLQPNTSYHYQLVAFSPAGTNRGSDRTFKTPQIPTTSTITAAPNPVVWGGAVAVSGFLTGPSIGGQEVALQANAFPFTAGFQQVGNTVITTPQGGYSFVVVPVMTWQLRVVDKSKPSVTSPVITENVALKTTLSAHNSHRVRSRVKFAGRVYPLRTGNAVLIQRHTSKGWKNVGVTLTGARTATYSGYAKTLKLHSGGTFRVVVRTTGGDYLDGTSRSVIVRVR